MFETDHHAPLQSKDVGVGTLLWYKGFTSRGPWDCPAIIYNVDKNHRTFQVMSLDDMRQQDQVYAPNANLKEPYGSQKNMRLASVAEVDAYLVANNMNKKAFQIIAEVQEVRKN